MFLLYLPRNFGTVIIAYKMENTVHANTKSKSCNIAGVDYNFLEEPGLLQMVQFDWLPYTLQYGRV